MRDAGAVEHAALAQQAVQARQVVVRHGHQQVVLEVVVDAVRRDQQALPPARERRARVAQRVGRVGHHGVLGDRADARHQLVGREPGDDPEQVEQRVARGQQDANSTALVIATPHRLRDAAEGRATARPCDSPRSRFQRRLARASSPVCPERSRQILRRRLARVIGNGITRPRSGSSAVQFLAWCCRWYGRYGSTSVHTGIGAQPVAGPVVERCGSRTACGARPRA